MIGCHTGPPRYCTYIQYAGSLSVTFTSLIASPRKQIMPAENHPCTLTKRFRTYWRVQCLSLLNFLSNKKPICKILRKDKNINFKFTIKFLMTLERPYIGYLGFLVTVCLKSVLMYSKGAICLSRLLFKMGLFTVHGVC